MSDPQGRLIYPFKGEGLTQNIDLATEGERVKELWILLYERGYLTRRLVDSTH